MGNYIPTNARKNLYKILEEVNKQKELISITPVNGNENEAAVIIAKKDWESTAETLYLEDTGELSKARERSRDNTGVTDIDWDRL
ncbi:type II toxin-antitoxin system Phd/YefM family antitoxin [Lentilactobacillus fungorum]|uniref:Antitoxin n=1 Tax=Lentilactobacillus fungorum TaxID=2201250 RepID=A0ABQ3VYS0_9LACO|nr:type II toxin-antitoxin system Phd/YefM family antitoxin [Lentilactobacillus fungorum]GHP13538.1 type II toxin-antitoxin system Phd/YefM family antitoxin [Lentilactobacillus fungorum]